MSSRSRLVATAAVLLAIPASAQASTVTVDRLDDPAGASACTAAANDCSLRGALTAAVTGDTVSLGAGVHALDPAQGELKIDKNLAITGLGADKTTISGGRAVRIFNIGSVDPAVSVTVAKVKLTEGQAPTGQAAEPGAPGGAVLNAAALTITEATLEANAAGNGPDILATSNGGDGGAIQQHGHAHRH